MMAEREKEKQDYTCRYPATIQQGQGQGLFSFSIFSPVLRDSSCVQSRPVQALFNDSWGDGGRSDSRREETHLNDDGDDDATDTKKSMASPPLLPLNMNGCHPVRKQEQQLLHTQRVLTCSDIYQISPHPCCTMAETSLQTSAGAGRVEKRKKKWEGIISSCFIFLF